MTSGYHCGGRRLVKDGRTSNGKVTSQTVTSWLKKVSELPPLVGTLQGARPFDELELDEMWSCVYQRKNKVWL